MANSQTIKWAIADLIGETIWKAEYRRATGKERSIHWTEVAPDDRAKYVYLGEAVMDDFHSAAAEQLLYRELMSAVDRAVKTNTVSENRHRLKTVTVQGHDDSHN